MTGRAEEPNSYDEVPYQSLPRRGSHPRNLETLATLFGMEPPPIPTCRVLELGCAAGGNLVPQAQDLPQAKFLGVDSSKRQIDEGRRTVGALGLRNIELRHADLLEIDDGWGKFDYILCHGVFSWVPPNVQHKILSICRRNLTPNGVAFVSYNTYPGWHLAGIARDLMCYHAAQFEDSAEKISQAVAILEFVAKAHHDHNAQGKLVKHTLKAELEIIRPRHDSYAFHEHLEPNNRPCYFFELMERAAAEGLKYLAEAAFREMVLENFPKEVRQTLRGLSIIQQEQYMDFLRCRRFRQTLLCHREAALERSLPSMKIRKFHVALYGAPEPIDADIRSDQPMQLTVNSGKATLTIPVVKAAFVYLGDIYPQHISFDRLHAAALDKLGQRRSQDPQDPKFGADALANDLMRSYCTGLLDACVHLPNCVLRISERPLAGPLARLQSLRDGQVTNQLHEQVKLDDLGRHVLHRLDGRHDRRALIETVDEAVKSGVMAASGTGRATENVDSAFLSQAVDAALKLAAESALLIG